MVTKKQTAAARTAAWKQALTEGRVVRFPELLQLTSYPTIERAIAAEIEARGAGIVAERITDYRPLASSPARPLETGQTRR